MAVWVTQWMCRNQHLSFGLCWDNTITNFQEIVNKGESLFTSGEVNRCCAICLGALHVEHNRTNFHSIDEAKPVLAIIQAQNLSYRDYIDAIRRQSN